jgi:hypothetical protein
MIKLYNYDKETLKFKRVLELETLENKNYEFCILTKIPKYNEETQYLEYDKQNDNWIIKDIENPVFDIEKEKENLIKQIKNKTGEVIRSKYPEYTQINILNGINGYGEDDRITCKEFIEDIIHQGREFQKQVEKLKTEKTIRKYSFEFKIKGE